MDSLSSDGFWWRGSPAPLSVRLYWAVSPVWLRGPLAAVRLFADRRSTSERSRSSPRATLTGATHERETEPIFLFGGVPPIVPGFKPDDRCCHPFDAHSLDGYLAIVGGYQAIRVLDCRELVRSIPERTPQALPLADKACHTFSNMVLYGLQRGSRRFSLLH